MAPASKRGLPQACRSYHQGDAPVGTLYEELNCHQAEELAVTLAEHDEAVRVLAFTGAGDKAFASGSDLAEVEHRDTQEGPRAYRARPRGALRAFCPSPPSRPSMASAMAVASR